MKTTKEMPIAERIILTQIPVGADKPRNSKELAKFAGLDIRALRACIRRLIVTWGIPIIATRRDGGGYFIPRNQYEFNMGVMPLISQHNKEGERLRALFNADLDASMKYLDEIRKEVEG